MGSFWACFFALLVVRLLVSADGAFPPTQSADGTPATEPRSLDRITDGLSNTVLIAEKRVLASTTPCNETTGWVSGYPARTESATVGHDTLFSGRNGPPSDDDRDESNQCTSQAGGRHGGRNVLYADGSVRLMTFDVDQDLWRVTLSVAGKEDIDFLTGRVLSE